MTDTRFKIYFGKYLPLLLVQQIDYDRGFVSSATQATISAARITHVALPCELTEKLTGTTVRA